MLVLCAMMAFSCSGSSAQQGTVRTDSSPHTIQFVTVANNVNLEVLDWGGSGRTLILLAGLGDTAHIFDTFAPKLTARYHVYGVTRRGFGASSAPPPNAQNYDSDRLGDDVLGVAEALKLERPVLAGHSIAGEELSSMATRHPGKIAGLIYLDAGEFFAFYDKAAGDLRLDALDVQRQLTLLTSGTKLNDPKAFLQDLLSSLPMLQTDLRKRLGEIGQLPPAPAASPTGPQQPEAPFAEVARAMMAGTHKYTTIPVPCLAIFAVPHDPASLPPMGPAARSAALARDVEQTSAAARTFENGVPSAHVVRLKNASHYLFISNEADVLRAMDTFLADLP